MNRKSKLQAGFMLVGSVGLAVFPLMLLDNSFGAPASLAQPFSTVVPVQPTFTPAIGALQSIPTPIPTVGPGQYFEEDDPNRPEVGQVHGDGRFGWGRIKDKPGLILIWVTDRDGAHYAVVEESSDLFSGALDSATGTRRDDGFDDYIAQREELVQETVATHGEGIAAGLALGVLGWGMTLCPATGGGGCVAGAVGAGAILLADVVRNAVIVLGQRAEMRQLKSNLMEAFDEAVP